MTWQNSVCMSMGRTACPDVNTLVLPQSPHNLSAIDIFYAATSSTLTKLDPNFFANHDPDIAGLLFVGLISATENYFRDIMGCILTLCPQSQAHAAEEKVQLGSLLWAENALQNRSAFEFMAFSSARNIRETVLKFIGHRAKQHGTFEAMLGEYDKLCEFRHAIVHSGHVVAGKNAIKLGLARTKDSLKVRIGYAQLQSSGGVCTALVQSANSELFETIISRWAIDWRKLPSWVPISENKLLKRIRSVFLSRRDEQNGAISYRCTLKKLQADVKSAFNL